MNAGGFGNGRLAVDGDRGLLGEPIKGECGGDTVMVDEEAVHVLDRSKIFENSFCFNLNLDLVHYFIIFQKVAHKI